MIEKQEVQVLISSLFEDAALMLGGLIATHPLDDEVVWGLVQNLAATKQRAMDQLDKCQGNTPASDREISMETHPAIGEFLQSLRTEQTHLKEA